MIDFDKPLQTRDGREVRIYAKDGSQAKGRDPIQGAHLDEKEGWIMSTWKLNGFFIDGKSFKYRDLVNVKTKKFGWLNIYENRHIYRLHDTAEEADKNKCVDVNRVACLKLEWEE